MEVELFIREDYLKYGLSKDLYTIWNTDKAPHSVLFGMTGSGKTYATKLILGRISIHCPDSQFYICDFKGDSDFSFLNRENRFYRFLECEKGLDDFYKQFQKRQSGEDQRRNFLLICFDEWASYVLSNGDKKKSEEEKRKLATLLMLGRSFNIHVLISQQRVDASYFNAARDNFNIVISLSNLSSEGKDMMFKEFKDQMKPDRKQGTGYMITNGADFTPIVVPTISDINRLNHYIKQAVKR
jgi:DNA segregation ATPase FtsK/SpoIIIE-like protein